MHSCFIDLFISSLGGSFPLPPAAAQLCTMLPPPGCFRGPFVAVDLLMDVFNRIQLPDHGKIIYIYYCAIIFKTLKINENNNLVIY